MTEDSAPGACAPRGQARSTARTSSDAPPRGPASQYRGPWRRAWDPDGALRGHSGNWWTSRASRSAGLQADCGPPGGQCGRRAWGRDRVTSPARVFCEQEEVWILGAGLRAAETPGAEGWHLAGPLGGAQCPDHPMWDTWATGQPWAPAVPAGTGGWPPVKSVGLSCPRLTPPDAQTTGGDGWGAGSAPTLEMQPDPEGRVQ